MRATKKTSKINVALFFFSSLLSATTAIAATDLEAQDSFVKARIKNHEKTMDHSAHENQIDKSLDFHGIFYGFLPCKDCNGIKATLSLKQNNNYLLVTQPAKESSREFYEKGKYDWNDEKHTLMLTPTKGGTSIRLYQIENEGTLVQLNEDGSRASHDADQYVLRSSDTVKAREVHIH
ncbi:MAG: copper resistance protein NlpE [Methylococcales bacterium]|nr:copper resistance protein NlpE [Methylococcaceae bacterium]